MSRSWAGGSSWQWRKIRAQVIARDVEEGWGCRAHEDGWCIKANAPAHTCTHRPEEVHHTKGRRVTGDDPRWQVTACGPCNKAIGDPTKTSGDPAPRPVTQW